VAAQQSEIQFLRTWQAGEKMPFSDLSGLTMASDGTVFWVERDRGQLWRVAGDQASAIDLIGKELAFEAKKLGGIAWLGADRFAVVNTRNDLLAIVDSKGKPERVFAASGKASPLRCSAASMSLTKAITAWRCSPSTACSCTRSASARTRTSRW
jgi:hypothetical protein